MFVGGAILGRKGRDVVLRFSESWGGLKKHIPLIKEALNSGNPIAPLLPKPPGEREILDALACGGVRNLGEIQGSNFSSIAGFGFNNMIGGNAAFQ